MGFGLIPDDGKVGYPKVKRAVVPRQEMEKTYKNEPKEQVLGQE
jgi:hypothetical protein